MLKKTRKLIDFISKPPHFWGTFDAESNGNSAVASSCSGAQWPSISCEMKCPWKALESYMAMAAGSKKPSILVHSEASRYSWMMLDDAGCSSKKMSVSGSGSDRRQLPSSCCASGHVETASLNISKARPGTRQKWWQRIKLNGHWSIWPWVKNQTRRTMKDLTTIEGKVFDPLINLSPRFRLWGREGRCISCLGRNSIAVVLCCGAIWAPKHVWCDSNTWFLAIR